MKNKWNSFWVVIALVIGAFSVSSCGVYSLSGATITGKTLYLPTLENKALNVVPTLSATLTSKLQSRILSQTGLNPVQTLDADYIIKATITGYNVSVSGLGSANTLSASQNRLTITLNVKFINNKDVKKNFEQSFTRFSDYPSTSNLESVESSLIETIGNQLADDIFNKAFVNW